MRSSLLINLGDTERLHIRAPHASDLDALVTLWTDPVAMAHTGGPRDPALIQREFGRYATDPAAYVESDREWWWVVTERSSDACAGLCGLIEKDVEGQTETELVYFFLPAFWGRGYAAEAAGRVAQYAFTQVGLTSLISIIEPEHTASASVARKLGMNLESEVLRPDGVTRQIFRLRRTLAEEPAPITHRREHYLISTEPGRLDFDVIYHYLSEESYWARGRPRAIIERAIDHSLCFGVYDGDQQVGFARVVTDRATFAWLCDLFILESHRGRGLGKWLVECIIDHPDLRDLRNFLLATADAHELYRQYGGFLPLQETQKWMIRRRGDRA
jgi:RimJ/RimL family protein N-acetyltransferase/GNAT superfamily N-acetyltransferase